MSKIIHYKTAVPQALALQVLGLAVANVTDIAMVNVPATNPLHAVYQYAIGAEVRAYLDAMDGSIGIPVELIAALNSENTSEAIGFLLYLPVSGARDACGVTYMAVKEGFRRQGVAKEMMAELLRRYPHAALTCVVEKVPYYEAMGYQVIGTRGPQVSMNTRDHECAGRMGVINVEPIYGSQEVRDIYAALARKHGIPRIQQAETDLSNHVNGLTAQVEEFIKGRG